MVVITQISEMKVEHPEDMIEIIQKIVVEKETEIMIVIDLERDQETTIEEDQVRRNLEMSLMIMNVNATDVTEVDQEIVIVIEEEALVQIIEEEIATAQEIVQEIVEDVVIPGLTLEIDKL